MKTNDTIISVLKENKNALRGLHAAVGFDFEKPFLAETIHGKFTVNSVYKKLGIRPEDSFVRVVILISKNLAVSPWNHKLHIAFITAQSVEIACDVDRLYYRLSGYNLDTFHTKKALEPYRKHDGTTCYIFAQHKKYMLPVPALNPPFDYSRRYDYISHALCYDPSKTISYIHRIELGVRDTNGKQKCSLDLGWYYDRKSAVITDFIDRSGYIVRERRADLIYRAQKLRAQRAQEAYKATDNADKVEELTRLINARKRLVMAAIDAADDPPKMYDAASAMCNYRNVFDDYFRYVKKTAERSFPSIDAANNEYLRIKRKLVPEENLQEAM